MSYEQKLQQAQARLQSLEADAARAKDEAYAAKVAGKIAHVKRLIETCTKKIAARSA